MPSRLQTVPGGRFRVIVDNEDSDLLGTKDPLVAKIAMSHDRKDAQKLLKDVDKRVAEKRKTLKFPQQRQHHR